MIPTDRTRPLNDRPETPGDCVLYVMSRDQRAADNEALISAQRYAIARKLPLVVAFCLYPAVAHRIRQQYDFMIDGLVGVEADLKKHHIPFVVAVGKPREELARLATDLKPAAMFFDFSPLRGPTDLKAVVADQSTVPCFVVDAHNIVPAWTASPKEEWAAYTFRPKINRLLPEFLTQPEPLKRHPYPARPHPETDWGALRRRITVPHLPGYTVSATAGEHHAKAQLEYFIAKVLPTYAHDRNNPVIDRQSQLSPYLHFGQISARRIACDITDHLTNHPETPGLKASSEAFLEELIVRKELSDNFCFYNRRYDHLAGIRPWALASLDSHRRDARHIYSRDDLEHAQTGDDAWNAAQIQLVRTGKIHGYMRMYWAKKLLEWTPDPETAVTTAVYLNDRYHLDGADPNGYVGILWSIGGVHDRPWFDRPIFGKIRYMSYNGLKTKFNLAAYVGKWLPLANT